MQRHALSGLTAARALLEGSYAFEREIRSVGGEELITATCTGNVKIEHFESSTSSDSQQPIGSFANRKVHEVCWLRYNEDGKLLFSGKDTPLLVRQSYLYRLSSGLVEENLQENDDDQEHVSAVENVLLHIIRTDVQGASVSFEQGSLLCEFDLSSLVSECVDKSASESIDDANKNVEIVSAQTHLCGRDNYTGMISIRDGKLVRLVFDVVGPEKSNRITTYFTKVS